MGKVTDETIRNHMIDQMVRMLRGDKEYADEVGRFVRHETGDSGQDIIYISEPQGDTMLIIKLEVASIEVVR